MLTFASMYRQLAYVLKSCPVKSVCRGLRVAYELSPASLCFHVVDGVSVYSNPETRTMPITFALCELMWILAGRNDVECVSRFNKVMQKFSDDGETLYGAYGVRIGAQVFLCVDKLCCDPESRQACVAIYRSGDSQAKSKDVPCNVFLQFLIRNQKLNLHVVARSSDFVTGLLIDAIHWQVLLWLVCNSLNQHDFGYTIKPGVVYYTIHSLHVYESDRQLIEEWDMNQTGEFIFQVTGTYEDWVWRARESLSMVKSLDDLIGLMQCRDDDQKVLHQLQQLHEERKFKVKR